MSTTATGIVARWQMKSETVTAIQIAEDNGPDVLRFCGIPEVPGLKATINALPGPNGERMPVKLRTGDWIVKHADRINGDHFTVHGAAAFAAAYEPADPLADRMFGKVYMEVQAVLDRALGIEEEDGSGNGIAGDVYLLAAQRDEARAELARADELIRRLERITTAWTRGMYSARIDCWRGDAKAAAECLSEGLDGYDGPVWNGTETGAEWWERTKAEEGL